EREPTHGSNIDISKIHECKQTLDLSAGTSINVPKEQNLYASAGILWNVNKENLRTMALNHDSLSPAIQRQEKSFAVSAADAPNERQQLTTPLNNHTTPAPTCQIPTLAPTVISSENINQAKTYAENDQVVDDEFINIFSNPVQDQGETSTRHLADLFTKSLPVERFQYLVRRLGMRCLTPAELEALANEPA
nr:ribonuclease H-like domain-containing protein [Tanacetum cinerariifolium]